MLKSTTILRYLASIKHVATTHCKRSVAVLTHTPRCKPEYVMMHKFLSRTSTSNHFELLLERKGYCSANLETNSEECFLFVKSLKLFEVLQHAFETNEGRLDEYFYLANIRVNKKRVGMKSIKIEENDIVDLVSGVTETHVKLRRVQIMTIKAKNPYCVKVNIWDNLVLPRVVKDL